jgi:hypothetical protein
MTILDGESPIFHVAGMTGAYHHHIQLLVEMGSFCPGWLGTTIL